MYVHMHAYAITINEKRSCEFEGEQKEVYMRVQREERKGKCCNYIIAANKKVKTKGFKFL